MTDTAVYDDFATNDLTETPLSRNANAKLVHKRVGMNAASTSTPLIFVEDRLIRLKQEFNRCMTDQRTKRQEIVLLKEQFAKQTMEIERLRTDENRALIEISTSREKIERLENKLKMAELELDDLRALTATNAVAAVDESTSRRQSALARFAELERQLHLLQKENDNFRNNCDHLHATIKELEDERDRIDENYLAAIGERDALQSKFVAIEKKHLEQETAMRNLEMALQLREMKCDELMQILDRERIDYDKSIKHLQLHAKQGKRVVLRPIFVCSFELHFFFVRR